MIVYRLCREKYVDDLTGRGAEASGGRWNGKGSAALYTSASRALCAIEILVHIPAGIIPKDYFMISIAFPDNTPIETIDLKDLPSNWNSNPISPSTQRIGNTVLAAREALVMKVPSAIIKDEWNYIINPMHKDFQRVKVMEAEPFTFDTRLFKA
ncbi:MAG TPA: RES family NAD+ phosphorylase [Mucilaginibacter sp.]|nr:RES family NAD+ phosphorylase [Mucilaginibacter sp.]